MGETCEHVQPWRSCISSTKLTWHVLGATYKDNQVIIVPVNK